MRPDLILGVALGEVHEPAAIVLCQRIERVGDEFDTKRGRWPIETSYSVQRLEALDRAGRYAAVVDRVAEAAAVKGARLSLLVDATGCGRPPVDLMRERRLKPVPVALGDAAAGARVARGAMQLSKRELVACVSIVLGDRRLKVAKDLPGADALARQLERFRTVKPAGTPGLVAAWREEERDELVRALALALWWGENRLPAQTKQPPVPRQPVKPEPPLTFDMAMKWAKRTRGPERVRL